LTLEVVPQMKTQQGGAIAMINTQAVRKPFAGEAGYAASKGALAVAVKYLAQELGPHGIRVNSVHMGWMWGAPVQGYVAHTAAQQQVPQEQIVARIAADIPLGHIPTDDDCAKAALFLVSDYAKAVTGASLDANGGAFAHEAVLRGERRPTVEDKDAARRDQYLEALGTARCRYVTTDIFLGVNADEIMKNHGGWVKAGFDAMALALKARAEALHAGTR